MVQAHNVNFHGDGGLPKGLSPRDRKLLLRSQFHIILD